MKFQEQLDNVTCNICNLISYSERLIESYNQGKTSPKALGGVLTNLEHKINQAIDSLGKLTDFEQINKQKLNKFINDISANLSDYKVATIHIINFLNSKGKGNNGDLGVYFRQAKSYVQTLNNQLNLLHFPTNTKDKLLHYQSTKVKQELDDVLSREMFRKIFNEAHGHHSHHSSHHSHYDSHRQDDTKKNLPQFNKHGDWYHDGICTHYDGIKMEDLYLTVAGRKLSCGFLIQDENTGKYLGCHPTGQPNCVYDIPKGCMKADGKPLDTAIRELEEETGIKLTGSEEIEDLGEFDHKPEKDIHLFRVKIPVDLDSLHCDSMFKDLKTSEMKPECDDFALLGNDEIDKFLRSIQEMIKKVI